MIRQPAARLHVVLACCLFASAVDASSPRAAASQSNRSGRFCDAANTTLPAGLSPRLLPRDDAPGRPDFAEFRRDLQRAVARRDGDAVLKVVDPAVKVDFGGGAGLQDFARRMNDPEQHFWEEFERVLALGGRFPERDAFHAPYTFSDWPHDLDAFACGAVVGTRVRLREVPRPDGRVVALLNHDIVEWVQDARETSAWRRVRLKSGQTGFVASQLVRSPVDFRALFEFKQGRWWLVAMIAGD